MYDGFRQGLFFYVGGNKNENKITWLADVGGHLRLLDTYAAKTHENWPPLHVSLLLDHSEFWKMV